MSIVLQKHALLLHKLVQTEIPNLDWIDLNFQQTFNRRTTTVNFVKTNRYKVGENLMCNRFGVLSGKITHEMLNLSTDSFKVKCKSMFLMQNTS